MQICIDLNEKKHPWDISGLNPHGNPNSILGFSHWLMITPRRVSWETTGSLSRVGVAAPKECSGEASPRWVAGGHSGGEGFFSDGYKIQQLNLQVSRNMYVV